MKTLRLLFLALVAAPTFAATDCPHDALTELVQQGKDLYLGELHGTVEAPALLRCLVLVALDNSAIRDHEQALIVSLEQLPVAREPNGEAWRGNDGRGSEAMWNLTQFLLSQEKAGRLQLHQQLQPPTPRPGESSPVFDPVDYERAMGAPLKDLAARGQLIALSGNAHSRIERLPGLNYDPAGIYAGREIVHVDLRSVADGTAWVCLTANCGVHELRGSPENEPGTLTAGHWAGHDFVYWLPSSTASPPKLPAASSDQRSGR